MKTQRYTSQLELIPCEQPLYSSKHRLFTDSDEEKKKQYLDATIDKFTQERESYNKYIEFLTKTINDSPDGRFLLNTLRAPMAIASIASNDQDKYVFNIISEHEMQRGYMTLSVNDGTIHVELYTQIGIYMENTYKYISIIIPPEHKYYKEWIYTLNPIPELHNVLCKYIDPTV